MASHSFYLVDDSPLERFFLQRIKQREFRGRKTLYVQALIEREAAQLDPKFAAGLPTVEVPPSPLAPDVLEALTRFLCGHARGQRMRAALAGQDQVLALTNLLEEHLARLEGQSRPLTKYPERQDDGPEAMAAEAPVVPLPAHPPKKTSARKSAPPGAA